MPEEREIENAEFTIGLRGYDRDEVDAYLSEIAREMRKLRLGDTPPPAPRTSDSGDLYKQVGEDTSKILVAAEEAGNQIRKRAEAEAGRLLADARKQAEDLATKSRNERTAAESDLRKLRESRDMLATQLEDVGRRLSEQISRLRAPVEDPLPPAMPRAQPEPASAPLKPVEKPKSKPAPQPKPAQKPTTAKSAPAQPKTKEAPDAASAQPVAQAGSTAALENLLTEVRKEREEAKAEIEEVLRESGESSGNQAKQPKLEEATSPSKPAAQAVGAIEGRDEALGDGLDGGARRLKRLLQEDQNLVLDKLRTHRGKGTYDENISPLDSHIDRFRDGMEEALGNSFKAGRGQGGGRGEGGASSAVADLVTKQVINPLRRDVSRAVDAGFASGDTARSIAEKVNDVFRVWKGVRTELLGEGLVYAAFHQGKSEAWKERGVLKKKWVLGDEQDCPKSVCTSNASSDAVYLSATFPSGHLMPPAHGGCTCTLAEG